MQTLNYTGERAIPWNETVGVEVLIPHIQRYAFATRFCWQKYVVDLACGSFYGAYLLSWGSRTVKATYIDSTAIAYALDHFKAHNLSYGIDDITLGVPYGEVYTAFECLEHLDDPLKTLELLKGSTLIYSVPVEDGSRFHKRAYLVDEIVATFGGEIYCQAVDGLIVPRDEYVWFDPKYILGVVQL